MLDDRYYQKGNPEKDPLEAVENKTLASASFNGITSSVQNPVYAKPESTLLPKSYIVIFSGGTEREKDYFHLIKQNPALYPDIKVDFFAEPNFGKGGEPIITSFAIGKVKEYRESASVENPDSYWLLTDVDHFEQFLAKMKNECDANGIELIVSNSCFEVWLYYSERSDRCDGFEIPTEKDKISSSFKTWANTQIRGGLKPRKAILKIEHNIVNARANYLEENGFPILFSTQMDRLAEKMLPFVKAGNEKILLANCFHRHEKCRR